MAKRNNGLRYVESMLTYLYDNTNGLESELNAALQTVRTRKVRWMGRPIGVKKEGPVAKAKGGRK